MGWSGWWKGPRDEVGVALRQSVGLAFRLARQTGRAVTLALAPGPGCLVPRLPGGLTVGLPPGIPQPPGMLDPRWRGTARPLRVSPWQTATEGMWFLGDRGGVLCMHLQAQGAVKFLRWSRGSREWKEVDP